MGLPSLDRFKRCTKCGCIKPLTTDYWHKHRASLASVCKSCKRVDNRKWREANPDKVRRNQQRHYWSNPEAAREYQRRYRQANPIIVKQRRRRWYENNREYELEYGRKWYEANFTHMQQIYRDYYQANKQLIAGKRRRSYNNNESVRATKLAIAHHRRGRQERQCGEPYTAADIKQLHDDQCGLCYYCRLELAEYHIEHQIPISRGGVDGLENIVLACPTCNLSKGTKTAEEFIALLAERQGKDF